jgi:hypothetical protein
MCRNVVGTKPDEEGSEQEVQCMHMMPVKVNVLDIKPPVSDLPTRVYITNKIGVQLKFPTLRSFKPIEDAVTTEDTDKLFNMIYDCTDYIFDGEEMYYPKESSLEEYTSFMESLTQEQFDKITGFFENLPKITHTVKHTCEKCSYEHTLHMEGLTDFFT